MSSYPFLLHIFYFIIFFHKHEADNKQLMVSQPVFIICSPATIHCFEVLVTLWLFKVLALLATSLSPSLFSPYFLRCVLFLQIPILTETANLSQKLWYT